jgi:hypothetical protein
LRIGKTARKGEGEKGVKGRQQSCQLEVGGAARRASRLEANARGQKTDDRGQRAEDNCGLKRRRERAKARNARKGR